MSKSQEANYKAFIDILAVMVLDHGNKVIQNELVGNKKEVLRFIDAQLEKELLIEMTDSLLGTSDWRLVA